MADLAVLFALARADQDRFARLATGTGQAAALLWEQLHPITDAELLTWQRAIVPMVRGAQQAAAAQRIGYLTAYYQLAGEAPVQLDLDITGILGGLRNGTAPAEVYARPVVTARTALAEGKSWLDAIRDGGARAAMTAETDVMLAARQAEYETMQQLPRVVGYRRVPNGGACKLCLAAATQRYHVRDLRPCHANCVVGSTLVMGPLSEHATRRWYAGEAVVLRTASGDLLTVTPNHPVLTDRGWVPAGLLREGDDVVRCSDAHGVRRGVPDEHQVEAAIEDVFRALAVDRLVPMPLAAEDFHGDVPDAQIDVVRTDGDLWAWALSPLDQQIGDQLLSLGVVPASLFSRASALGEFLSRSGPAPSGSVRSRGALAALLGRGTGCRHAARLGPVASLDARLGEPAPHHGAVDLVGLGEGEHGLAGEIAGDGVTRNGYAPGPRFDPAGAEFTGEGAGRYADLGARLSERLSGQVQLDRLVLVRRIDLATHVYNLQTTEGWYSANGIIVSNCRCGVVEIIGTQDPGHIIDREARDRLKAQGAIDEATARKREQVRYGGARSSTERDLFTVHEHGELGPTLTEPGQKFTTQADIG